MSVLPLPSQHLQDKASNLGVALPEAHLRRLKTGTQQAQGSQIWRALAGGWTLGAWSTRTDLLKSQAQGYTSVIPAPGGRDGEIHRACWEPVYLNQKSPGPLETLLTSGFYTCTCLCLHSHIHMYIYLCELKHTMHACRHIHTHTQRERKRERERASLQASTQTFI